MGQVGLDFETYGAVDLPKHGMARYMADESFTALIGGGVRKDSRGFKEKFRFDFVMSDRRLETENLQRFIGNDYIVAHNAQFEQGVLQSLGLHYPVSRFIDSAVVARAAGAGSKLEAAAPQLLGVDKMEMGGELIRLFSIPGPYQEVTECRLFNPSIVWDNPTRWADFMDYCVLDAELGLDIVDDYLQVLTAKELEYQATTFRMNDLGWPVDVRLVEEMLRRSNENKEQAEHDFRVATGSPDLNLNSLPQMKAWCEVRGIKARSFAEKPLEKLRQQVQARLQDPSLSKMQYQNYQEVVWMLTTKQVIGGSSLKKLPVILDMQVDGRLKGSYLHVGASQTWRTTGRGVQMQNLKRIGQPSDMSELDDPDTEWDNEELARNIRQCFTSSDPDGFLVVGDFSSVESRGLAWLGNEQWKLNAYHDGQDLYKVLAARMKGITVDQVDKDGRQFGKVGELSCGYQAGPGAVQDFAATMGTVLTEAEATKMVWDWRDANPNIVALWAELDSMLHELLEGSGQVQSTMVGKTGWCIRLRRWDTPLSLLRQHSGAQTIALEVTKTNSEVFLRRFFHGCHIRGRNVGYYKPSELKGGDLWKNYFTNPKTKQIQFYQLYGGKLAGILTQSFCREIFMLTMADVERWCAGRVNVDLIGQFHDEIVLDWRPRTNEVNNVSIAALDYTEAKLERMMVAHAPTGFPMGAEIKHDYRYTK